MRLQRAVLPGLVLALAVSTSAQAAPAKARPKPKPVCNLLTDDSGDWKNGTYSGQSSNALDVVSGDLATGKNELIATLRLASMSTDDDNWRKLGGYNWAFGATLNGVDYKFRYEHAGMFAGDKKTSSVAVGNTTPGHTFEIKGGALIWKIKRSELPSLNKKPGQAFTAFHAQTGTWGSSADTAFAPQTTRYVDRALHCLAPK